MDSSCTHVTRGGCGSRGGAKNCAAQELKVPVGVLSPHVKLSLGRPVVKLLEPDGAAHLLRLHIRGLLNPEEAQLVDAFQTAAIAMEKPWLPGDWGTMLQRNGN
ncbi:hypothetical protein NDU88_005794 [Pleurodeles waltl]|uniref:Uncharacterized protein n=1 Tax=Pleurodeles waltl TaxID=8319 RepID=A0AAV7SMW2_PLEWA|nr:hypothetical protein NDU88_005794 [Pleurodeles waltl]